MSRKLLGKIPKGISSPSASVSFLPEPAKCQQKRPAKGGEASIDAASYGIKSHDRVLTMFLYAYIHVIHLFPVFQKYIHARISLYAHIVCPFMFLNPDKSGQKAVKRKETVSEQNTLGKRPETSSAVKVGNQACWNG